MQTLHNEHVDLNRRFIQNLQTLQQLTAWIECRLVQQDHVRLNIPERIFQTEPHDNA